MPNITDAYIKEEIAGKTDSLERQALPTNKIAMEKKDADLIRKAKSLHSSDWNEAERMKELAKTDEAKKQLHFIARRLYHLEEYSCHNL